MGQLATVTSWDSKGQSQLPSPRLRSGGCQGSGCSGGGHHRRRGRTRRQSFGSQGSFGAGAGAYRLARCEGVCGTPRHPRALLAGPGQNSREWAAVTDCPF